MRSRLRDSGDPELELREINTDRMTLVFLPSVGGRMLSLRVDGRELLWQNPHFFDSELRAQRPRSSWRSVDGTFASWSNVGGSKSWPAPQGWGGDGEWAGPPDAVLDSGRWTWYDSEWPDGGSIITMTSPDDPRTGLRMRRRFIVPASGSVFSETISLTNVSDRTVTWAAWEVCQVATTPRDAGRGVVRIAVDDDAAPLNQGDYRGTLEWSRTPSGSIEVPVQDVVAKRGFPTATGSIAWIDVDGATLELRFAPQDRAYPDGGSRAELWMQAPVAEPIAELSGLHPDAYLAELEVLGPLTELEPGETTHHWIRWEAASG